ncbi:MAG: TonB family protein [Rikenellaceae bacterium]|nr:TonB family protein [Rikenellaceae bacterium]
MNSELWAGRNLSGKVVVTFVIDTQGDVGSISIVQSPHSLLSCEALSLIAAMPEWTPATQNGKPVNMRWSLPIRFGLADAETSQVTDELKYSEVTITEKAYELRRNDDNVKRRLGPLLGKYYFQQFNYEKAFSFLQFNPKTAEQYNMLAFSAFKLDRLEAADKYYDEALKLNPSLEINAEARQVAQKFVVDKREQERLARIEAERRAAEAEKERLLAIKNAGIGDKLEYSETWQWRDGSWIFFTLTGSYSMKVTCFIERKEGDRYQIRVGDVTSSDPERHTTPTINGVRAGKGDVLWIKPPYKGFIYSD